MLRFAADWRTLLFVAIYCALVYVGFAFWYQLETWQALLLFVAMCNFSFFAAVMVHNTIHCPIFRQRWMNKIFQHVLSFCYGHAVSAFVPGHNFSHHKYTQREKDVMRTTKMRWRWNFLNQLLFFHTMLPDIMRDEQRFVNAMRKERPAWFWQYWAEMAVFVITQVALLYLNWKAFVLLVFIPHHYGVWGIVGVNFWQHDGCDPDDKYNHSRTFTGKLLNWFSFNNGYHGMHHDQPTLHWSLLPEYHQRLIHPHIHPALEQKSLVAYLWKNLVWPGKRLTFDGRPVILPPKARDGDWVAELRVNANQLDLGAEA